MKLEHFIDYLNDHLAGSVGATALIDDLIQKMPAGLYRTVLRTVHAKIKSDQQVLKALLEAYGAKPPLVKSAGTWLLEKIGKLKSFRQEAEGTTWFIFESLEILELGIRGKRLLWETLRNVHEQQRLPVTLDFPNLLQRAKAQELIVRKCKREIMNDLLRTSIQKTHRS